MITGEHNSTITTETILSVTCGVYVEQYQKLRHQRLTSKVDFNEKQNNRRRQRSSRRKEEEEEETELKRGEEEEEEEKSVYIKKSIDYEFIRVMSLKKTSDFTNTHRERESDSSDLGT